MCLYDLQKAADSIQYPILFKRLYKSSVDGKVWMLLRRWYTSPMCMVRVNGACHLLLPLSMESFRALPFKYGPTPEASSEQGAWSICLLNIYSC